MKRKRLDFRRTSSTPLIVLAGLPFPLCAEIAGFIKNTDPARPTVIFESSGMTDRVLYKPSTVEALIRSVSSYAERQKKATPEVKVPDYVMLLYVPSEDSEMLLTEFEFFAFPVPLNRLVEYDRYGRQLRHNRADVREYVTSALRGATVEFMELKRRLSTPSAREPLLLPPNNFEPAKASRLAWLFSDIYRRKLPWYGYPENIGRVKVSWGELPRLGNANPKTVLIDSRGLLFPIDGSFHAPPRETLKSASIRERQLFLRSCFRFGVRLTDGFHHDAQFSDRPLRGIDFECSRVGNVSLSGTHANIYPNDYVRSSKGKE